MGLEPHYGSPSDPNRLPGFLLAPDRHHKPGPSSFNTAAGPVPIMQITKDQFSPTIPAWHTRRKIGVDDGTRTHDDRHHKPGLYQLSYAHHRF